MIKKDTNIDNRPKKNDKKKAPNMWNMFLIILLAIGIFKINFSDDSVNKKLILNEPSKITLKNEFNKLVESGNVETVYMNDEYSNILFTVKEGTKVNQVDYKTNEGKTIKKLEAQSERYKRSKIKSEKAIFVYKSFNPDVEDFKDYLLSKNVQVLALPGSDKNQFVYKFISTIVSFIMYFVLFKILFFPTKNENPIKDSDIPSIKFDDIAGNEEAKNEMQFLVNFLRDPEKAKKLGATMPKGILFYGPPGTGKTLLAKAIAGEAGVPFYERSGTDFIDKYVGVGSQKIRSLFKSAAKSAPCIVFIDEIDSIGGVRGSDVKEYDNTLNQLLVELDGFNSNNGVVVIAATNRRDTLDSGLTRPGRFDRHIAIELPPIKDREKLFNLYLKNKPLADDVDIKELASLSYGYSGAAIKSFVNEAALIATQYERDVISKSDFDEAFIRISLGAHPRKVHEDNADNAKLIAYHEAGHAIITKLFTKKKVNKVTIIGSSNGVGGFTSSIPEQENFLSKEDLLNEVRIAYGGRVAEYLLFDKDVSKVTTGASNDLKSISSILDYIIRDVGMYDSMLFRLSDSEYSKDEVMQYKKELAKQLYDDTLSCLENNIYTLHAVANALLEKETLNDEELSDIINTSKAFSNSL